MSDCFEILFLFIALVGDTLHKGYTQTQIDCSEVDFCLLPVLSTFLWMWVCKPGIPAGSFPCSSKSPRSLFSNWQQFSLQLFLIFSRNVFALPGNKYLGLVFIVYVWSFQWLDLASGLHGCHFKPRWKKGWEICENRRKMWITDTSPDRRDGGVGGWGGGCVEITLIVKTLTYAKSI